LVHFFAILSNSPLFSLYIFPISSSNGLSPLGHFKTCRIDSIQYFTFNVGSHSSLIKDVHISPPPPPLVVVVDDDEEEEDVILG
jgi:hypothetical protein